jgi:hypothetical protein
MGHCIRVDIQKHFAGCPHRQAGKFACKRAACSLSAVKTEGKLYGSIYFYSVYKRKSS